MDYDNFDFYEKILNLKMLIEKFYSFEWSLESPRPFNNMVLSGKINMHIKKIYWDEIRLLILSLADDITKGKVEEFENEKCTD